MLSQELGYRFALNTLRKYSAKELLRYIILFFLKTLQLELGLSSDASLRDLFIYLKYNTMVLDSHLSTLTCEAKYTQKAKKRYKPNKLVC